MTLEMLSSQAKERLEEAVVESSKGIRNALDALKPLLSSPLVDNGLRTAVADLSDELDSLEDRIPGIRKLIVEKFGSSPEGSAHG